MINFASDNASSVHPNVIKALAEVNVSAASPYGNDPHTQKMRSAFCELFDRKVYVFPVFNGTGANTVSLDIICDKNAMILSSAASHISEDECGAPVRHTGCLIRFVNSRAAKVTPESLKPFIRLKGDIHKAQPKVLSISQATEVGEIYYREELVALKNFCKANDILIHMDGARLANAAAASQNPRNELGNIIDCVDILSFGGTKNGLMGAEAIIVKDESFADQIPFAVKQGTQLASKMRYLSAQFLAIIENDLWLTMAQNANSLARRLHEKIKNHVVTLYPVEANMMFVKMRPDMVDRLLKKFYFYPMYEEDGMTTVRLMTSWNTTASEVDLLAQEIVKLS